MQVAHFQRGPSRQQKNNNAAVYLCFLNFLAFLRPAADRAFSLLPCVVIFNDPRSRLTCQMFHFPFAPRGGFLCENGAPLFFTCFDYVVLLWVESANSGHRRLHSSRLMNFNKRRETFSIAYWRICRSWIVLPHIFLNNRTSPEKPVWATWAHNHQLTKLRLSQRTKRYNIRHNTRMEFFKAGHVNNK
jgi:hypothetical protein